MEHAEQLLFSCQDCKIIIIEKIGNVFVYLVRYYINHSHRACSQPKKIYFRFDYDEEILCTLVAQLKENLCSLMSSKENKTPCQIFSCSPAILDEIIDNHLSNLESEDDDAKEKEKDYMVHILHQTLLLSLEISSSALICSLIMMMQ